MKNNWLKPQTETGECVQSRHRKESPASFSEGLREWHGNIG